MSIYSKVTEQDLIFPNILAEQQKKHRAIKIKFRTLKQTLDIKLAENLSPFTKNLEEVNETTKKLREVIEKSEPENNIPQAAIERTSPSQPIQNNEGVMYETELENTLENMKNISGF